MNKNCIFFILFSFVIISCGTQKRLADSVQKAEAVKEQIHLRKITLDSLEQITRDQKDLSHKDSLLSTKIEKVIRILQSDLNRIGETVSLVELASEKKSNFHERKFYSSMKPNIDRLDSFQTLATNRDRVYELLGEAVRMSTFNQFKLGTFFEPGVYKIPPSALPIVKESFDPVLDSIVNFSNRFSDVKRSIYIVFVGYADGTGIAENSMLYKDLTNYLRKEQSPDNERLNYVLSNLRASELLRGMKIITQTKAEMFINKGMGRINYTSYGRGENLPFESIKDYKVDDERRRVVVFYWSVLPDLKG